MTGRFHLHQIYYSAGTREGLDPGFIALDNLANERPDWREYWPIRRFLIDHAGRLDETAQYGFFSPKFQEKTGLSAAEARAFMAAQPGDPDVILLSPFFDQMAFYWNIFEQAMNHHKGFFDTFKEAAELIVPRLVLEALATDSRHSVFSNFFAAKPAFWRAWLAANETLFALAEANATPLGRSLNAEASYGKTTVPAKVFMMERMATLLLATQPHWKVARRDPLLAPIDTLFAPYRLELICMDALKIAARERGVGECRDAFRFIRQQVAARSKAAHDAAEAAKAAGRT
jgi:hypothetical protein